MVLICGKVHCVSKIINYGNIVNSILSTSNAEIQLYDYKVDLTHTRICKEPAIGDSTHDYNGYDWSTDQGQIII